MRKIIVTLLFFILVTTCLVGCTMGKSTSSSTLSNDQEIINLVKEIEENDAKYYVQDISYEEYLEFLDKVNENLSKIMNISEEKIKEFHIDRCYIFEIAKLGRRKDVTIDESQKWSNDLFKKLSETNDKPPWGISKVGISDVFYDKETNFKCVFTKIHWRYYLENRSKTFEWSKDNDTYSIRKYTFVQEESYWKLLAVEMEAKRFLNGQDLETKLDKLNGAQVEYTQVIEY